MTISQPFFHQKRNSPLISHMEGWVTVTPTEWHQHDGVITWKCFLHYWPFVWGIHQWLVDSPHKGPVMQHFEVFPFVVRWKRCWTNSQVAVYLIQSTTVISRLLGAKICERELSGSPVISRKPRLATCRVTDPHTWHILASTNLKQYVER